jgi:hypothetical protein
VCSLLLLREVPTAAVNSTKNYSENSTDKFFASKQLDKKIKQLDKEMLEKIRRGITPAI